MAPVDTREAADREDRFLAGARQGVLPLLIWAAHFFLAYAFVAIGCRAGLDDVRVAGMPAIMLVLLGVSVLALGWLVGLVVAAVGGRRRDGARHPTLVPVRLAAAVLALVGVLWTTVPMTWLPPCSGWGDPMARA